MPRFSKSVTIRAGAGVNEAAERLLEHGISRLPVVSDDGAMEGIVTSRDLLRATAVEEKR